METTKANGKPFTNPELSAFCGQMALVLKSGISSVEGISIMLEDASESEERALLTCILEELQQSGSLTMALTETGQFPSYLLHMTEIGEETGTLDDVMESLRDHYEREEFISRTIRSAVTYPMILSGMMIAVILVLLVRVMPIFQQVFVQLGTEMTGFSQVLMNIGTMINRYSIVLIVLFAAVVLAILWGSRTRSGRAAVLSLGYFIGVTRPILEQIAASRFAGGMALTLRSGLNPERCLELVTALNEDPHFQTKLDRCHSEMEQGMDLSEALHAAQIFTGMNARMASIGSKTGTMDQAMQHISDQYQEEIDSRINNLLSILEPTLVIVLSLIVGVILLSVMLPLMGIMSSL